MDAGIILQTLIVGIAAGSIYGLVASGFALVYRLTTVLEFAHGDLAGAAAFAGIVAAAGTTPVNAGVTVWRYLLAVAAALSVGAAAGALLYRFAVRPFFRRASAIGWIGSTIAIAFAIEGGLAALFPRDAYALPDPFRFAHQISLPGGATLPWRALWVLGVGLVVAAATRALMEHTAFGFAVTAIASEPSGARAIGLPVERLITSAFALAGVLAAIAGMIGTPTGAPIGVRSGAILGLKGIAAALLGGLDDPDRIFLTAIGLGVLESAVATLHVPGLPRLALGAAWRDIAPLLLVVVVLAIRTPRHGREIAE